MDSYVDERILCETLKDIANACDGYWLDRDVGIFYRLTAEEAKDYITFFCPRAVPQDRRRHPTCRL